MNLADNYFDFALHYVEKAQEISKKYNVSAEADFNIQCEIAAAAYILEADHANYTQLDNPEALKQSYAGAIPYASVYYMAKGLLIQLKDKGVTKENVYDYMDRRIAEFEDAAKAKWPTT